MSMKQYSRYGSLSLPESSTIVSKGFLYLYSKLIAKNSLCTKMNIAQERLAYISDDPSIWKIKHEKVKHYQLLELRHMKTRQQYNDINDVINMLAL
ncbi:hypothetical protein VNO77_25955 [Canavalia gladiata]|uniref:Uncharacterized protein n=1 Tax=Canavalia gladiata TaxID=3824 RepID=A0AAN9KV76_CANGL